MGYHPLFVDLSGRPCIVIGGGAVASRRIEALLEADAVVTVISPELERTLAAAASRGAFRHLQRRYMRGDLGGYMLAYVATGDSVVSSEAAAEARELGIPINVADAPELCTFIAPSMVRRGELKVAISTGGQSPALARRLREELESIFGPEYGALVEILGTVRQRLKTLGMEAPARAHIASALAASELRQHLGARDFPAVDRVLRSHLGFGLAELELDSSQLDELLKMGAASSRST